MNVITLIETQVIVKSRMRREHIISFLSIWQYQEIMARK